MSVFSYRVQRFCIRVRGEGGGGGGRCGEGPGERGQTDSLKRLQTQAKLFHGHRRLFQSSF